MADYTKHQEGHYQCRVVSHEVGTKSWGDSEQDQFQVNLTIEYRETGATPDMRMSGDAIRAEIRLTDDEKDQKKFFGWLHHLGYTGRISALDKDRELFAGKLILLECSHWTSPRNGNKNEFWNVPRADALKPIKASKLIDLDTMWAPIATALPDGGIISDDDVPF